MIKHAIETVEDLKRVLDAYPNDLPVVLKHGWHPTVFETEYGGKQCLMLEPTIDHDNPFIDE